MLIPNQIVKMKWNPRNKKHYANLGYKFTKIGDEFYLKAEDLMLNSKAEVQVQCDFCGKIVVKQMQTYNQQHHPKYGDCCIGCQPEKNKLVCLDKYGVDNGSKTQEAIDKIKNTCIEKYGVDNPARIDVSRKKISQKVKQSYQNKETVNKRIKTNREKYGCDCVLQNAQIIEKCKNTLVEKYGVDHPKKSQEIREKEKEHNREKYGCDYYLCTDECKDRVKATNLAKYGVEYTFQSPEIRAKGIETLAKNGVCPTSSQQLQLRDLLEEIYGECELNKPLSRALLDCVICVEGQFIDIEYDGWYWHKNRQEEDKRRNHFVMDNGYKVLRIRATREIPTKKQIIEAVDYLVKGNHSLKIIELDI